MKRFLAVVTAWTRAIAADQASRRRALFHLTLGACVAVFAGSAVIGRFLEQHPWLFIAYWLGVAWLTLTIVLVAVYDALAVLADGRRARRELEHHLAAKQNFSTKSRPSNTSPDQ